MPPPPPDAEQVWEADERANVMRYLDDEGLIHGKVGADPAWTVYPHVALWAVESVSSPGLVGWWIISGDLPTDYCSADGARDPRSAVHRIAKSWKMAVEEASPDRSRIAMTGLSSDLRPLLASRADLLLQWTETAAIWPSP